MGDAAGVGLAASTAIVASVSVEAAVDSLLRDVDEAETDGVLGVVVSFR